LALDHFSPGDSGSEWFVLDALDLRGSVRWAGGLVGDYAYRPLVVYDSDGNTLGAVVRHQLLAHLGGSVVLWDRLKLGVSLPILLVNEGDALVVGTTALAPDSGAGVGDLRFAAETRLYGSYGQPFSLALATTAFLPTGRRAAFTSDGYPRASLEARVAGDAGLLAYAGATGLLARAERELAGAPIGTSWTFAAAVGLRLLERRLLVGPELWGSTVIAPSVSQGIFTKTATPFELVVGAHYRVEDVRFGVGVGPGFGRGLGTPALRVLAGVEWSPEPEAPPPPPHDRDGDGLVDRDDSCPDAPGPMDARGCPPPPDRDGDGIVDASDACPAEPGVASADPAGNGCPVAVAPVVVAPPAPPDRDADHVPDADDACPDTPGTPNANPSRNGCPLVKVTGERIEILERVEFELGSAKLKAESDAVLSAVLEALRAHPEIRRVEVQGHTDSRGQAAKNRDLSRRRAEAVVAWLVERGIAAERLKATGFGADKPLTTNATDEGRQTNRRVEFHIVEVTAPGATKSEQGGAP
jgi:outer membrane protein OmpA-like peptidoglycan-associated protein